MTTSKQIDDKALREQVQQKYKQVATQPDKEFHFHTGRHLAQKLGYPETDYQHMPVQAIESFAGVANPFSLRRLQRGEKVVDVGAGAGFDCFVAANMVGEQGVVVGVDMTQEMLDKASSSARSMDLTQASFRAGLLEDMPVENDWADVVISNGVINLCADKKRVFSEIHRILKPGGYLQFADIANSEPIPQSAIDDIDLWTA